MKLWSYSKLGWSGENTYWDELKKIKSVAFSGCETWSLWLREDQRPRISWHRQRNSSTALFLVPLSGKNRETGTHTLGPLQLTILVPGWWKKLFLKHSVFQLRNKNENVQYMYKGCNRRNGPDFGRVFLTSYYTDITQKTYIQSSMVTEILVREFWNFDSYYSLIDYQIHIETGRNMWFL